MAPNEVLEVVVESAGQELETTSARLMANGDTPRQDPPSFESPVFFPASEKARLRRLQRVLMLPTALKWRIEENLLLKQAVRRLEAETMAETRTSNQDTSLPTAGWDDFGSNDWENSLFAPLGPDHSPTHSQQEEQHGDKTTPSKITVSFAVETNDAIGRDAKPISPSLFASNSSNTKSLTSLTVDLMSTDIESAGGMSDDDDFDFYPVELESEDAPSVISCPRILTQSMMQYLHDSGLPETLHGNKWERCFAIGRDGDSFISFLNRCSTFRHTLLVIQTTEGHILGGFAAHTWQVQEGFGKRNAYFGTGQSFLFCSHPGESPELPSSVQANACGLQIFKWTGVNDYCQICDEDEAKIAMGGGGNFGLIVEDGFWRGQTGHCGTYGNPPLVPSGFFEIAAFEVYGLMPLFQSFHSSQSSEGNHS